MARAMRQFEEPRTLLRVLPLVSVHSLGTRTLTLISAELYEEGVVVIYQVEDEHFDASRPGEPTSLTLSGNIILDLEDDVGTDYRGTIARGGGSPGLMRFEYRFSPRIPLGARGLTIAVYETETTPIEEAMKVGFPDLPRIVLGLDL